MALRDPSGMDGLNIRQTTRTHPGGEPGGAFAEAATPFGHATAIRPSGRSSVTIPALRRERGTGRLSRIALSEGLSRATGLPRVDLSLIPPDPALSDLLDPALCLRHQCVPWQRRDSGLILATARPEDLDEVRGALPAAAGPVRAVIADRDEILRAVETAHAPALAHRAATRVDTALSARTWQGGRIRALRLSLGAAVLAGPMAIWPYPALNALLVIAFATLVLASLMKCAAAIAHLARPDPEAEEIAEDTLPAVTLLVPLFREDRIAETLLKRLERLDYPRDRLETLLVLEQTDRKTRDLLNRTALPPWMRVVTVPDGAPRTKPRAMNYALDHATGDIVGIYDAEDAPDPDQLRRVAAAFAAAPPDVACLQGALDYYNPRDSWISRCFTIEYNTWFRLLLPGMSKLGFALPLGGTTLFIRRAVVEQLGAWDAHNVTEDADLGFRLARAGYRTRVIGTTTREEANSRALPWCRQRSRWLKGYLVTYLVHMRHPLRLLRDLGPWQFLGFQAHFVTALSQFALAPLLWLFWLSCFGVDLPFTTLDTRTGLTRIGLMFLGLEGLTIALGFIATRRASHRHLWIWVPTLHVYWPLGAVAMWKALFELVVAPFYWDKTAHGVSPSAREAQPTVPMAPESSLSRVTKAFEM